MMRVLVASSLITSEKRWSKVDRISLILARILFQFEGARGRRSTFTKALQLLSMYERMPGFQDKLENESLHSVVVRNADCSTFDDPQVPSNHLVLERSSRHNVDRLESDVSSLSSSLPFGVLWDEMKWWRPKKSGRVYVQSCLWRCNEWSNDCDEDMCCQDTEFAILYGTVY